MHGRLDLLRTLYSRSVRVVGDSFFHGSCDVCVYCLNGLSEENMKKRKIYEVMVHMIFSGSKEHYEELDRLQREDGWEIGGQMTYSVLHTDAALYVPLKREVQAKNPPPFPAGRSTRGMSFVCIILLFLSACSPAVNLPKPKTCWRCYIPHGNLVTVTDTCSFTKPFDRCKVILPPNPNHRPVR